MAKKEASIISKLKNFLIGLGIGAGISFLVLLILLIIDLIIYGKLIGTYSFFSYLTHGIFMWVVPKSLVLYWPAVQVITDAIFVGLIWFGLISKKRYTLRRKIIYCILWLLLFWLILFVGGLFAGTMNFG